MRDYFLSYKFFPHWRTHADSSFEGTSDVSRLQIYHTNVLFGTPDQDQMLDVWESQTAESSLWCTCHSMRRGHHLSLSLISWIPQDISVGIHANILDHTPWNPGKIHFKGCSVHRTSYSTWPHSDLVRYTTPGLGAYHMGSCRTLQDTCLSKLVGWGLSCFISTKAYNFLFGITSYYYLSSLQVAIYCCLAAAHSSYWVRPPRLALRA